MKKWLDHGDSRYNVTFLISHHFLIRLDGPLKGVESHYRVQRIAAIFRVGTIREGLQDGLHVQDGVDSEADI